MSQFFGNCFFFGGGGGLFNLRGREGGGKDWVVQANEGFQTQERDSRGHGIFCALYGFGGECYGGLVPEVGCIAVLFVHDRGLNPDLLPLVSVGRRSFQVKQEQAGTELDSYWFQNMLSLGDLG